MHVWMVEMWNVDTQRWEPTDDAAFTRTGGRRNLAWHFMRDVDRFRLRRYERKDQVVPAESGGPK